MKMKKLIMICVVVTMFLAAMATIANASTITYNVAYDDNYSGTFDINEVLSVPQFDSSMGILLNVTIDFEVNTNGTIGFENFPLDTPFNGNIYTYFYFQNPVVDSTRGTLDLSFNSSTIASVAWDVQETYALNLTGYDGAIDFAGTSGFSTTYVDETDSGSLYYDSDLSAFIGSSTVDFELIGDAYSAMVMPGNGVSSVSTSGLGDVEITYEYIPEPATLSLLVLGGVALLKRKQK